MLGREVGKEVTQILYWIYIVMVYYTHPESIYQMWCCTSDNGNTTQGQRDYNYQQSMDWMVVENAFGMLKGRGGASSSSESSSCIITQILCEHMLHSNTSMRSLTFPITHL